MEEAEEAGEAEEDVVVAEHRRLVPKRMEALQHSLVTRLPFE